MGPGKARGRCEKEEKTIYGWPSGVVRMHLRSVEDLEVARDAVLGERDELIRNLREPRLVRSVVLENFVLAPRPKVCLLSATTRNSVLFSPQAMEIVTTPLAVGLWVIAWA